MALFGATAIAADAPPPVYKMMKPQSATEWSGFYLGAHVGHAWGRTRVIDNGVLTEPGAATNGFIGGALAGYNWQRGAFVYGFEVDIGGAALRGKGEGPPPPPPPAVAPPVNQYVVGFTGDIRGRVGYIVFPDWLLFAAGGLAFSDFQFQHGETGQNFGTFFAGWTVGGGIEHMFTRNLIGRLEYLYADYGNKTYQIAPGDFYNAAFTMQTLRGALIWKF